MGGDERMLQSESTASPAAEGNGTRAYIPRAGEEAWRSPSVFSDTTIYCFAVKADPRRIGEMLATYIAHPSNELGLSLDVRATTLEHVFFVFVDTVRAQQSADFTGRHRERMFAVVVPAIECHPQPKLVTFVPYLYSTQSPGWCADREILGIPQQHGSVQIDGGSDKSGPRRLRLNAHGIERFAADAKARDHEILSLTRQGDHAERVGVDALHYFRERLNIDRIAPVGARVARAAQRSHFGMTADDDAFLRRSAAALKERTPAVAPLPDLAAMLSKPLTMLFLKQFRDVVFADRACYQAIVEATCRGSAAESVTSLGPYTLCLADNDSAPIRRELGIPPGEVAVDHSCRLELRDWAMADAHVVSNPGWNPAMETSVPDKPSRLPRYVDRGGELVWQQPSLLRGARIYGFGVKVGAAEQEALLARYLNDLPNGVRPDRQGAEASGRNTVRLRSAGLDVVLLLFVEYERISSGNDDDERLGSVSYREFLVMQLAMRDAGIAPALDWFIPFIYLDADAPRLGGREIYGYPKQFGSITFPARRKRAAEPIPPRLLELKALVIPDATKPSVKSAPIVRIEGPAAPGRANVATAASLEKIYSDPSEMFLDLLERCGDDSQRQQVLGSLQSKVSTLSDIDVARDIQRQNALVLSNIGNVFLKQFRDCADPHQACYQAVCRTDTIPGAFVSGGRLNPADYTIEVHGHASEPLVTFLGGGQTGGSLSLPVKFAYCLELNFELTRGRVLANAFEAPPGLDESPAKVPSPSWKPEDQPVASS